MPDNFNIAPLTREAFNRFTSGEPNAESEALAFATMALGLLYGAGSPGCAAALCALWCKAYPDQPLPPPIRSVLEA